MVAVTALRGRDRPTCSSFPWKRKPGVPAIMRGLGKARLFPKMRSGIASVPARGLLHVEANGKDASYRPALARAHGLRPAATSLSSAAGWRCCGTSGHTLAARACFSVGSSVSNASIPTRRINGTWSMK